MAINACTIDGFTLHGKFCRDKFTALIPILHPTETPGTNPRVLRDTFKYDRPFEIENEKTLTFEQPIVSVTVEFYGATGTDTQDVSSANVDFVTVTGLEVQAIPKVASTNEPTISVNIFDLTFD